MGLICMLLVVLFMQSQEGHETQLHNLQRSSHETRPTFITALATIPTMENSQRTVPPGMTS